MTRRTKVHRAPQKQVFDPEIVRAILARAILAHVAISVEGQPYAMPLACAPFGSELLLHGSTASRLFKELLGGAPACVTITHIDGLVLARSSFESSMHYQSLMAFGSARMIDQKEKPLALQALTDHLFPLRRAELRNSTDSEIKATAIVAFPLTEISVKVSKDEPNDAESDLDSDVWAGILPLKLTYGIPAAAKNLRPGISVPDYISTWPPR